MIKRLLLLPLALVASMLVTMFYAHEAAAGPCELPCVLLDDQCVCDYLGDAQTTALLDLQKNTKNDVVGVCTWDGGVRSYTETAYWTETNQRASFVVSPAPSPRTDWNDLQCNPASNCELMGLNLLNNPSFRTDGVRNGVSTLLPPGYAYGDAAPQPDVAGNGCRDNVPTEYQLDSRVLTAVRTNIPVPQQYSGTLSSDCQTAAARAVPFPGMWCYGNEWYCEVQYTLEHEAKIWPEKAESLCEAGSVWGEHPDCTCACTTPNPNTHMTTCTCDPVTYMKTFELDSMLSAQYLACQAKEECEANNGGAACDCVFSRPNDDDPAAYACP